MQIRGSQKVVKILFDFSAVFPFSSYLFLQMRMHLQDHFSSTYPILIFLVGLVWRYRDKYNLRDPDTMKLLNTIRDPGDQKQTGGFEGAGGSRNPQGTGKPCIPGGISPSAM